MRIKKIILCLILVAYASNSYADFMKVTLLGTGSPRPSIDRYGPAVLVEVGGKKLLFDAGRGVVQRLRMLDVPISEIQQVFITHLHSDHISALDDVWLTGWIYQRKKPLNVYGPDGIQSFVKNMQETYEFDANLRHQHAGLDPNAGKMVATNIKPGVIFSENGVKVTAFLVDHKPVDPAYGFRIDFGKRSVVISGDTTYSQSLVDHALGIDLLVHEIIAIKNEILDKNPRLQKIERYHTDPEQLIKVLNAVKPRVAVMTHVIVVGISEDDVVEQINNSYKGEIYMGEDLMSFEIGSSIKVIPYPKN